MSCKCFSLTEIRWCSTVYLFLQISAYAFHHVYLDKDCSLTTKDVIITAHVNVQYFMTLDGRLLDEPSKAHCVGTKSEQGG